MQNSWSFLASLIERSHNFWNVVNGSLKIHSNYTVRVYIFSEILNGVEFRNILTLFHYLDKSLKILDNILEGNMSMTALTKIINPMFVFGFMVMSVA